MKIEIPGYKELDLKYLVLDYNGTIARDGIIPESIRKRITEASKQFQIYVVTADTHGNAARECRLLPVEVKTFPSAAAAQEKEKIVKALGAQHCICIGNGRNDMEMCRIAGLSVAVMDAEGMYAKLAGEADVCVRSMEEALEFTVSPKRIIATLRG